MWTQIEKQIMINNGKINENLTPQNDSTFNTYLKSDKNATTKNDPIKQIQRTLIKYTNIFKTLSNQSSVIIFCGN